MCCSMASEVEVQLARDVVVEQQHSRRERDEIERQGKPPFPGAHSKKRKEDQNEDDRVQDGYLDRLVSTSRHPQLPLPHWVAGPEREHLMCKVG